MKEDQIYPYPYPTFLATQPIEMGLESPIGGECALLLLFLSLLFTIVAYIVYSGLLAPVEVSALSPPFEPSVFAYKVCARARCLISTTFKTLVYTQYHLIRDSL